MKKGAILLVSACVIAFVANGQDIITETDSFVTGGLFNRFTTALSWYPNAHFRYEINYGHGQLDNAKFIGKTDFWQFRVQFEL